MRTPLSAVSRARAGKQVDTSIVFSWGEDSFALSFTSDSIADARRPMNGRPWDALH